MLVLVGLFVAYAGQRELGSVRRVEDITEALWALECRPPQCQT